jgi:hypothetical protein
MAQDCKTPFATTVLGFLFIRQPDQRLTGAVRRSAEDSPDVDAGFGHGGMRVRVALLRPLPVTADLTSSYRHVLPNRHACDFPGELGLHRNLLELWRDSAPTEHGPKRARGTRIRRRLRELVQKAGLVRR